MWACDLQAGEFRVCEETHVGREQRASARHYGTRWQQEKQRVARGQQVHERQTGAPFETRQRSVEQRQFALGSEIVAQRRVEHVQRDRIRHGVE